MLVVGATCVLLLVLTTVLHYEVLRGLSARLPAMRVASRSKLLLVIFAAFLAHAAEILLYALALWALARFGDVGRSARQASPASARRSISRRRPTRLSGTATSCRAAACACSRARRPSTACFSSAGPHSYVYIAMERFWREESK